MPEHFNQRRPKTSYLLGQAIGESLGKASDMYLKGKMENYFQNQKDERASKIEQAASERSAEGYEKLTGIKGLKDHLRGIPLQHHGAAVKEFGGGGAQDYINNASPSYQTSPPPPQPPPSPQKTSTSINQDIAAAQRMGLSGQEVPGMPGIPAKTPQGVNEPQQAEGDREQPQIPGGQVRSKMRYPLAEMSNDEFNNTLRQYPGATNKKLLINAREKQQDRRLKEAGVNLAEEKLDLSREKFSWQKSEKEIQKAREGEQENIQSFIEGAQKKAAEVPVLQSLLNVAKNSISTGNTGLLSPDNLADLTHIEAFRTAKGEALRSVAKEYIFSEVKGLGSNNNQMLDKQILSIIPNVGKTQEANLAWTEIQQMKLDLALAPQMFIEELKKNHLDKNNYPKQSLIDDVNKHVREYANKIQENTAYKIQEIEENNADLEQLTNLSHVDNVYLTEKRRDALIQMAKGDKEKAIKVALKLGYKIPDRDVYASQK